MAAGTPLESLGGTRGVGRPRGAATGRTREIADRAAREGLTPLEYLLKIMRQEPTKEMTALQVIDHEGRRLEAAKAAAPYIHPRLQAIEHSTGKSDGLHLNLVLKQLPPAPGA